MPLTIKTQFLIQLPSVEQDSPVITIKEAKKLPPIEVKTFQSFHSQLVTGLSHNSIMLANDAFSRGLITQADLHALRIVSSNEKRAAQLVDHIQQTLIQHPFKFESFVSILRSSRDLDQLAEAISWRYRFNLVCLKMKKVSEDSLDLNYLSAELNNSQLISDDIRRKAATARNFVDMCSVFLSELKSKNLLTQFLDLLEGYPNTKSVGAELRASEVELETDRVTKLQHSTVRESRKRLKSNTSSSEGHPSHFQSPEASKVSSGDSDQFHSAASDIDMDSSSRDVGPFSDSLPEVAVTSKLHTFKSLPSSKMDEGEIATITKHSSAKVPT